MVLAGTLQTSKYPEALETTIKTYLPLAHNLTLFLWTYLDLIIYIYKDH